MFSGNGSKDNFVLSKFNFTWIIDIMTKGKLKWKQINEGVEYIYIVTNMNTWLDHMHIFAQLNFVSNYKSNGNNLFAFKNN